MATADTPARRPSDAGHAAPPAAAGGAPTAAALSPAGGAVHDVCTAVTAAKAAVDSLGNPYLQWSAAEHRELVAVATESIDALAHLVTDRVSSVDYPSTWPPGVVGAPEKALSPKTPTAGVGSDHIPRADQDTPDNIGGAARGWAGMTRVLVVLADPTVRRVLMTNMRAHGYRVLACADLAGALGAMDTWQPTLVVIDMDVDCDETAVIVRLRTRSPAPIIVLSEGSTSDDHVVSLDAGADAYLSKPFEVTELFARIRAATRRSLGTDQIQVVHVGSHCVDLVNRRVVSVDNDGGIHLTRTEWEILEWLLRNPHKLLGRRELVTAVWGPNRADHAHYLRNYIVSLRRKLEPDPPRPRHLLTEPGLGYRFEP